MPVRVCPLFVALSVAVVSFQVQAGTYAEINCPGLGWKDWQCKAFTGANGKGR